MRGRVPIALSGCAATIAVGLYLKPAVAERAGGVDSAVADAPADAAPVDAGTSDVVLVDGASPAEPVVDLRLYVSSAFEASFAGPSDTLPFLRGSIGVSYRRFPRGGGDALDIRAGLTAYMSRDLHTGYHHVASGFGGEVEIVSPQTPIGLRLGFESAPTIDEGYMVGSYTPVLITAGARLHLSPNAFLALDLFHFANTDSAYEAPNNWSTTGGLVGLGITGYAHANDPMVASSPRPHRERAPVPAPSPAARPDDPARRNARQRAWPYLDDATKAALRGDCATVDTIGTQVREIDPDFYTTIFSVDPIVLRCARATAPASPLLRDAGAADDDAGPADARR